MITPSFSLTATERVLPKLALDFTTASLDPRVTFTRSGATATRVNSSGYVEVMAADTPRFDFSPTSLVCAGLLIEEQRTNTILRSEEFNTTWTTSNASIGVNQATSPANTLTADKVIEDTANTGHFVSQIVSCTASQAYTFSVYVKAAGRTQCRIRATGSGSWLSAVIDLTTGLVVGSPTGTISVVAAGDSWYRISGTANSDFTGSNVFYVYPAAGGTWVYQGNGVDGVFTWGAQLEAGAFATSYIPTTTTALTRNADVATMTGTNFSDWFNASEGTFVVEANSTATGTFPGVMHATGAASKSIGWNYGTTATACNFEVVDTTTQANIGKTASAKPAFNKLAGAYKVNDFSATVNAGVNTVDSSGTVPTVDTLKIGTNGTWPLNGCVKSIRYFPTRLTSAQMQAFSK